MSARDGGPAFPFYALAPEQGGVSEVPVPGMSLRDWFAGQALAGLCAASVQRDVDVAARTAYNAADAMLAARNAPESAQEPADGEIG